MVIAVVRIPIDKPMGTLSAVRAYISSQLAGTSLRVDSIEVETPDGPSSDEPLYADRDEC